MPRSIRLRATVLVAAFAVVTVEACSDDDACPQSESHCADDHTVESCEGTLGTVGHSTFWRKHPCEDGAPYCVDVTAKYPQHSAICSSNREKSPECAEAPNADRCIQGRPWRCANGYGFDLPSCAEGYQCVVEPSSRTALCATSAAPDPLCPDKEISSYCRGASLLRCERGFVVDMVACSTECQDSTNRCR